MGQKVQVTEGKDGRWDDGLARNRQGVRRQAQSTKVQCSFSVIERTENYAMTSKQESRLVNRAYLVRKGEDKVS